MTSTSPSTVPQFEDQEAVPTLSGATRQAVKDAAPFAAALVPFAFAIGGASAKAGLSGFESAFGAIVLLAGAGQLAAVELLGSGGDVVVIVAVVMLINLRFMFYGAGLARWFDGASRQRRLLLAIPIVDQTFMLCQERFSSETDLEWRQRYYLTASAVLAGTFVSCQVVAHQIGSNVPDGLGLHLAAPLAFAGMLAKAVKGHQERLAGALAGGIVVFGTSFVGFGALPLGVAIGVGAALASGRRRS